MNQKSRQKSKNDVEKDFFKLMNSSNFEYGCRNNIDNCKFVPIYDEMNEITFVSRYHDIFDQEVKSLVTPDLLKQKPEEEFNEKLTKLDKEDKFYKIKFQTIQEDRKSSIEAAENFEKKLNKNKRRKTLLDYDARKNDALINQKVKSLIDFDDRHSASIKSIAIEKTAKINLTTRFFNGKMIMFSKV